jgi:opacity protein-like surface antigen
MLKILITAVLAAAIATPAMAFDATSPEDVLSVVQANGASATLKVGDDGKPWIAAQAGKTYFSVDFYDCDQANKQCGTIAYTASWDFKGATLEQVNRWNRFTLRCPAYLDKEGRLNAWMPADLTPDLSRADVEQLQEGWLDCFSQLNEFANSPGEFLESVEK